jgi:hypothetical protein
MRKANEDLAQLMQQQPAGNFDIENVERGKPYVEMVRCALLLWSAEMNLAVIIVLAIYYHYHYHYYFM